MTTEPKITVEDISLEAAAELLRKQGGLRVSLHKAGQEAWFYDAASRTIYDENRLAVARDVGPDDARTILGAMGCSADDVPPSQTSGGPTPLFTILDDMLAYEAAKFDGGWFALCRGVTVGPFPTEAAGREYADAQPGGPWLVELTYGDVNSGDMVDAFTEWRVQLKAALGVARPATLAALAREAAALFREYEAHHQAKASEAGRPEKAQRNADIAARLESALGAAQ